MLDHDEEVIEDEDTSTEEESEDNKEVTTETETETENSTTEDETETETETELPDYRQKDDIKTENKQDMVPLAKHMAEKSKLKSEVSSLREELESLKDASKTNINSDDLDSLAEEYDLEPTFVKKLANTMVGLTSKQLESKIAPILQERQANAADSAFEQDFTKNILLKYPELADKKEDFKRFAFSPDFLHLKTLEDIRKNYFNNTSTKVDIVKKETVEYGSAASVKTESIDFSKMTEEQHLKVLKDPKAREKYFAWQEEQD